MNQIEFNIILPSNSSMKYYPNNTTTNYSTRLPREIELYGEWSVGLSEIHIPCTTLHLRREDTQIAFGDSDPPYFQHGVYNSIQDLVKAINKGVLLYNNNLRCDEIFYDEIGGFVSIVGYSENFKNCKTFELSTIVWRILGYEQGLEVVALSDEAEKKNNINYTLIGKQPASLSRAIPDQLFVYSNLCEPCIVGDTHAPLLRIVDLDAKEFSFGSTIVKRFSPINYVPLLNNRFQTIDIDIRDQFGKSIPFEFGTLTAVLHFKRQF